MISASEKSSENPIHVIHSGGYTFSYFNSIEKIATAWNEKCPNDQYWKSNYHVALESSLPNGLKPFYCFIRKENKNIGIAYFQYKKINLAEAIKLKKENFSSKVFKKVVLANLNMDTLIVGNLLLTGKYGFVFDNDVLFNLQFELVESAVKHFCDFQKSHKINIGPVLIKDFFENEVYQNQKFFTYTKFIVQPNMIMAFPENWSSMQDYSDALKAKSRTRYNRARNKFSHISCRFLNEVDLETYKIQMHKLYRNISDNVDFNLFVLSSDYFLALKKNLKDNYIIKAYFNNADEMVGFFTMMNNNDHLDAHFLGYNPECNKECQLYLNMLYDMIDFGCSSHLNKIFMSRTALEIKSSVGAKPYKMYCYLKHFNSFYNSFTPKIVNLLYRDETWEERSPFK